MAEFSTVFDTDSGITHIVIDGEIRPDDLKSYMQSEDFANRSNHVFCDVSNASFGAVTTREIIHTVREVRAYVRESVRAAFILRKGLHYGLANMIKVYTEQLPHAPTMETFTNKSTALEWLTEV